MYETVCRSHLAVTTVTIKSEGGELLHILGNFAHSYACGHKMQDILCIFAKAFASSPAPSVQQRCLPIHSSLQRNSQAHSVQ
jgi:hypothetical protein